MQLSPGRTTNPRLRRRASPTGARLASPRTRPKSRPCPKPIEILHKCSSEPLLFPDTKEGDHELNIDSRGLGSEEEGRFPRLQTFNDIFSYPKEFMSLSPLRGCDYRVVGYEKDTKVLITVTVEGSPGPIRTLIKLGTSVDETIKLLIHKYMQEGRTPQLEKNSPPSAFDLYLSYFSFQSLERSYTIGDIGSRSFYLRRSNQKGGIPEVVAVQQQGSSNPPRLLPLPMVVHPSFFTRKFSKIMRRMRKLFKIFGCLQSR